MSRLYLRIGFAALTTFSIVTPTTTPPSTKLKRSGSLEKIDWEKGEIVVHGWLLPTRMIVPAYHYMWVLREGLLFHAKKHSMTKVLIVLVKKEELLQRSSRRVRVKKLEKRKDAVELGETGEVLAQRMVGLKLPFHFTRCNCRHYVEYVVYGRTFGKFWSSPADMPINDACPLHRQVLPGTLEGDTPFALWTKKKEYCKVELLFQRLPGARI